MMKPPRLYRLNNKIRQGHPITKDNAFFLFIYTRRIIPYSMLPFFSLLNTNQNGDQTDIAGFNTSSAF
ncbi:MAG: hypothetical protein QG670_252 [Thermoproteota archaeon]|nr:hypothetical protein [Thermoproteota archaeon]